MITRRRSFPAAALIAALALAACGGSAQAPAYPEEPLPASPEGTLDLLDRAEGELRLALGEPSNGALDERSKAGAAASSSPANQPNTPPPAIEAPPPPPAAPPPRPTRAPVEASPSQAGSESVQAADTSPSSTVTRNDPCANACRALASMERATEHLCSLAGSADARCAGARARVKGAGARVHEKCPACSS